jgi:outer membrane receptor protein involved in Fe transport
MPMKSFTSNYKFISYLSLILGFILVFPLINMAQIQGKYHDINNEPILFATIVLINQSDSSLVTGIQGSDVGTFSISNFKPGKYLIKASAVGYKTVISAPFEITSSNEHIHLDPLIAEEDVTHIDEVSVIAKKPIYEQQIDRLVINVENSITSTGTTALNVLEKSPGVSVNRQNGTLSLGGKDGVLVMINGKETHMPVSAAIEMLNGMSSENIKKIELVTTPPSKYAAEGDAGIINIVLKKDDDFGTNGTYTLGAGLGADGKLNGSINMNHHVKKVNYYGMYSSSYDNSYQEISMDRLNNQNGSVDETKSESLREPVMIFNNARLGFDYTITSKTVVGVLASGYTSHWDMNAINDISYLKNNQLNSLVNQKITESNKWKNYMGNLNIQHSFKEDEVLEFNADYLHYDDNNPSQYFIQYMDASAQPTSTSEINVTKVTPISALVGKLDYTKNFGKDIKLESGLKYTNSKFVNDVSVANKVNGTWKIDIDLTNKYDLSENISAAYSSLNYKFDEKTSLNAGLRYEYTNTVLNTESEKGIIDRHYGELFPTLYLSRDLNKNNNLQFSYSRRITRPTYNELAPFIFFQTPDTYIAGNVNLQPSISNVFKADYKYKSVLLSYTYTNEANAIRRFQPTQDSVKNILYLTSQNLDLVTTSSLILSFPLRLTKWWNIQNNLNGIIQNVHTNYEGQQLNINSKNFMVDMINNFKIMEGFTGEITGEYHSPSLAGINKSHARGSVSVGLQKKTKNEKNTFSLNLSDVFKTGLYSFTADVPELNIHNSGKLDFEPRVLRFTYSHNFGSNKVKAARKRETGSDEEQKRVQ